MSLAMKDTQRAPTEADRETARRHARIYAKSARSDCKAKFDDDVQLSNDAAPEPWHLADIVYEAVEKAVAEALLAERGFK